MSRFDSIVIGHDFVSDHWLTERFPATVKRRRDAWRDRETRGKATPRRRLIALASDFGVDLTRIRDNKTTPTDLHARVRSALLDERPDTTWSGTRGNTMITLPAAVYQSTRGTALLVVQAQDAHAVEDLLDGDGDGQLIHPAVVGTAPEQTTARVLSEVFAADEPPGLVLVLGGAWALLAERERWPEGRWLAVDLATACDRRDVRAGGELETIAALFSGDTLLSDDDGTIPLLGLLDDSVNHSIGVSADLRDGVRESVEHLATEVLRRRRAAGVEDINDLADDLTTQCLRYLFRIVFLLYAEARPELHILPIGTEEYTQGYGLDRLRDLALTELTSDATRSGTHLHQSLQMLFRLVNRGYPPNTLGPHPSHDTDECAMPVRALRSELFADEHCALIDNAGLGNDCLQRVLSRLVLSREQRGRDRGFVSYAQLGVNQLGSVYEGLMSYRGMIANEELWQVAKNGDPELGSWVVPPAETSGFDESWFVMAVDANTGEPGRKTYRPGDFVFLRSGRTRQRMASYYTPEVLTRCVVTHSLAELRPELIAPEGETAAEAEQAAADLLDLTVCEPALGSGSFLIETVGRLADAYVGRLRRTIPMEPDEVQRRTRRAKAHLAVRACYGVDLQAEALELADVTLWLDTLVPQARAPWYGLRLRRGNSLIGARRDGYRPHQLEKRAWLSTPPTPIPLTEPFGDAVHHFLLPARGWGAVADTHEAKEGRPEAAAALKTWRRVMTQNLTRREVVRLGRLARRIEALWALAAQGLTWAAHCVDTFAPPLDPDRGIRQLPADLRATIVSDLADPDSAYGRLRLVLDAWAALWFWPIDQSTPPPTRTQWLDALDALLGHAGVGPAEHGDGLFTAPSLADAAGWQVPDLPKDTVAITDVDTDKDPWSHAAAEQLTRLRSTWLNDVEADRRLHGPRPTVADVLDEHPWLRTCRTIADREAFLHWELDFAPVFLRGGFDLQVGNPPWVRPDWDDDLALAEYDPWFALAEYQPVDVVRARRADVLADGDEAYLRDRTSVAGLSAHLGSAVDRPTLAKTRPDSYRCFLERIWRSMASTGVAGLIHPESHFTEARAGALRRETYRRLRRHWHFRNELKLFEIGHAREYGIHIYGPPQNPRFLSAASLFHPDTIDRSLRHDGIGPEPGIRTDEDRWDLRPHATRLVLVDTATLTDWAALVDEPGTPALQARLLRPVNTASQRVLRTLSDAPRWSEVPSEWTSGWNEATDRRAGHFESRLLTPANLNDLILQGPHFTVAAPFSRDADPGKRDYIDRDLEQLPSDVLPRTNYQRRSTPAEFRAAYPPWNGRPSNDYWRLAWRRMADSSMVRTLNAALIPPGPTHVHGVLTARASDSDLAVAAGMWSSLPIDFLVKVSGFTEMNQSMISRFPHPRDHPLVPELILRALRLNCLTAHYAPFWADLFDEQWREDTWTRDVPAAPLGDVGPSWTMATPLRRDAERRQALVEMDAVAAVMLGISADDLCAIYRTQFGVLRKYERATRHDAQGRKVPNDVLKEFDKYGSRADLGRYQLPFCGVDRELDMTIAHEYFTTRLVEITTDAPIQRAGSPTTEIQVRS